jgi:Glycosyl hydrolases family 25
VGGSFLLRFFSLNPLVEAIDASSYQVATLPSLIRTLEPELVICRLYLPWENPSQDVSKNLVSVAKAHGCKVGGYFWAYSSSDPKDSIKAALSLALDCGFKPDILWIDVETYTDSTIPNESWLRSAQEAADSFGQKVGAYSGINYWKQIGNPSFPNWYLWSANYNNTHDLVLPVYGDMILVGHQYTDVPCDRSVFLRQ